MRKNIKTIIVALLSLTCLSCFSLGCSKCADTSDNSGIFENFKDGEITVRLGEKYRLEIAPLEYEGAYCEVTARVTDAKGGAVSARNGYFIVTDVGGYAITYTAKGNGEEKTRTVRLKVKNEREPNVVIGECDTTYEIGETFLFPEVAVYDLAGESLTPTVGVYKLEGETQIEQVTTENTFLCDEVGVYIFKASATNSFQVTGASELRFYVNGLEKGEIEGFSNAGSKNDVVVNGKYTDGVEWLEKTDASMGERQGVLKINVNKTNQQRNILTIFPKQAYESYLEKDGEDYKNKKFVVTMYVAAPVGSIPEMYAHFTSYRMKDIKYNMWYDYSFDAEVMLKGYTSLLEAEKKVAEATDAQALATAEKELETLQNNTLSLWGTFRTEATVYVDRIAFAENEVKTSVATEKSYAVGEEISLAQEMPIAGYDDVEYTVLLEGKPIAITGDKFTPKYVSDKYTVVASLKGSVNELNDNAEFHFKTTTTVGHIARLNDYTAIVNFGDEVIEPTVEIYDERANRVEGYKITRRREFVSNAGVRSEASSFTSAKSGTFEYVITAEKEGVKFIQTASVRVGPFEEYEVISLNRPDVLELFGTTKATVLTNEDLKGLKGFADITATTAESVLRFTKNNSDKSFELNFQPVHTLAYYKRIASIKPTLQISLYLASANDKITKFALEIFQNKERTYVVPANTWTTIEIPIDDMIEAMEDNRLYALNTWTHCALKIKPNQSEAEYSIANTEFNLFLGGITLTGDENGDNYAQDW